MKLAHLFPILLMLAVSTPVLAQAEPAESPVAWTFELGEQADAQVVLAKAEIADGWYVYSQFLADGGPIPTSLDLSGDARVELLGEPTEEGDAIEGYDELFGMDIVKYGYEAQFAQAIRLAEGTNSVVGTLEFMACTDKKCLPPSSVDIVLTTSL